MVVAIGVLLAVVCLLIVLIPFFKYRHSRQMVNPLDIIDELGWGRRLLYEELATLKESHELGQVPQAEFQANFQNLRRRAAENLRVQRQWEQQIKSVDEAIEQEVIAFREVLKDRETVSACPECGTTAPVSEANCPHCGTALGSGMAVLSSGGEAE